ncbi:54S ribosomal protein L4 [Gaeumannomyces tritici R3-111a-1]|uniref:Large ribosomal subunit protein uL29m n=1 Tax=Gaeumannomyces tritici (strain R3-111a-1) TaxID=644352 RepID=J3NNN4_GAET3|nr:54S ribosomal protein L4 [Gaeumannomyces tritici R3-111a-1]EJT77786.1 54S ribosomal protein L4 [Gaeumannomyces tritici R3-111a-1]
MASPGTVRPAVSRVLQRCHVSQPAATLPLCQSAPIPTRLRPAPWLLPRQHHQQQQRSLSGSAPLLERKTRDSSKLRGVSTIHRSGPREVLSVSFDELPRPNPDKNAGRMTEADNEPGHGLWGFFFDKKMVPTPAEAAAYGRAWTVQELRGKNWDDLHALWWVCCRERNRIATANHARDKHDIGFGAQELGSRDEAVRRTMKAIKHVLTERYYAWEDAVELAKEDPEINMSGKGPMYTPSSHYDEELVDTAPEKAAGEAETAPVEGEAAPAGAETAEKPPSQDAAAADPSVVPPSATKEEAPIARS